MHTLRRWIVPLCLATALVGCGKLHHADPMVFNQTITEDNKKLNDAGKQLGGTLAQAITGKPGSADLLKTQYADLKKTVSDIKAQVATMPVPDDASSQALYTTYKKYLDGQESMATNEFDQMIKCAEDSSLSPQAKAQKLTPLLQTIQQKETTDLTALQAAQRTFASEHNITLK